MKVNKIHLYVLVGLVLLNLGFYFVNLNDFFVSDDFDWLYNAKTSEHRLTDYFSANYYGERGVGGSYRPMVNLVFLSAYKFFGLNPLPYHLLNLFFHIGTCFLVYLLTLLLLGEDKNKQKIAILASVFFSILPNHSEAVIWIAAVADPLATFFYLLAFYSYLVFRKKLKFGAFLLSVLFFIIALLTKEIAITLPLLIVVWELYEALDKNKFDWKNIIFKPFGYWLILILYFIIRYFSIGLLFGYYAQTKIRFDLNKIMEMFIALFTNLFFYGRLRVYLTNYLFNNKIFFFLFIFLLITVIWLFLREQRYKFPFLFDSFCILILPVLFLSFGLLSDDGERYNYLPSVVFCIFLSLF
ncbi:MAG: hypothetical protein NTZ49_04110, partial [Candidatus Parcubacteria bacterium]|nr:hypothetical protein [Candidatus Parcubacteria bacterium]